MKLGFLYLEELVLELGRFVQRCAHFDSGIVGTFNIQ